MRNIKITIKDVILLAVSVAFVGLLIFYLSTSRKQQPKSTTPPPTKMQHYTYQQPTTHSHSYSTPTHQQYKIVYTKRACLTCGGRGKLPTTPQQVCAACGGRGYVAVAKKEGAVIAGGVYGGGYVGGVPLEGGVAGVQVVQPYEWVVCSACGGTGLAHYTCPSCNGSGYFVQPSIVGR